MPNANPQADPDIFISYSRADADFVRRLVDELQFARLRVWLDLNEINAGSNWAREVDRALKASRVLLLIVSPDSMASENVEDEWGYFKSARKPIIPVRVAPAEMNFQLVRLQRVDFHNQDFALALKQLTTMLDRVLKVLDEDGARPRKPKGTPRYKGLVLDSTLTDVIVNGQRVGLTPSEFAVLAVLVEHSGLIIPYDRLYIEAFGDEDYDEERDRRRLSGFVSGLRKKLAKATGDSDLIHTHWTSGYQLKK